MDFKDFFKNLLEDTKVELTQEFDRNFERKAFFTDKWKTTKHFNSRGSLLLRSGRLRNSINSTKNSKQIKWKTNLPYAKIHNEGGEIIVTERMKKFFWAMYYKAHNASNIFTIKAKRKVNTKRTRKMSEEAQKWKAMALMPIGKRIKIEQRQFIGDHPVIRKKINELVKYNMQEFSKKIIKKQNK